MNRLQIIITLVLIVFLIAFLRTNSYEYIPKENANDTAKLNTLISLSKVDTDKAISELSGLNEIGYYTDYKKNYILARLYEKKDDTKNAISIYEKIIQKKFPLRERIIFHLANLKAKNGNDKEAIKLFSNLLRNFSNSKTVPQAKYYLAQAQLRLKLTNEAINTLVSLRSEFPDTQYGIATNYYLGEYAYNKGNNNEALKFWRQYLEQSPDGRFAADIADILSKDPAFYVTPHDYSLLGDVFFHKKDYINAAHYYKFADNSKKYFELGYSLFKTNNKAEALKFLKEFAHKHPDSKNAKLALLYASRCLPNYARKFFFVDVAKSIPKLAYYAAFKEGILEEDDSRKTRILTDFINLYPDCEFTLDAVWEIMWLKIKEKNYKVARNIGEKFFYPARETSNYNLDEKAKIGFWLGKISEITRQNPQASKYYKQVQNLTFDNYYSIRAANRLAALNGGEDNLWNIQGTAGELTGYTWLIPNVIKLETIKKYYGSSVAELISLQQFNEAIELIGKSKSPTKRVTVWLKALNNEYEKSINIANSILASYSISLNSPVWKLAYPFYFCELILNTCKNYVSLDPFLVCGVIRQESRFDPDAISTSNAYGLLQLILPTAKRIAKEINVNVVSQESLRDPKINIALGIHYLNSLINQFNNPLYAVAAYNAGPRIVNKWIADFKRNNESDLDFFVEEIPYDETRGYIKKVFSAYWTYVKLYRNK